MDPICPDIPGRDWPDDVLQARCVTGLITANRAFLQRGEELTPRCRRAESERVGHVDHRDGDPDDNKLGRLTAVGKRADDRSERNTQRDGHDRQREGMGSLHRLRLMLTGCQPLVYSRVDFLVHPVKERLEDGVAVVGAELGMNLGSGADVVRSEGRRAHTATI